MNKSKAIDRRDFLGSLIKAGTLTCFLGGFAGVVKGNSFMETDLLSRKEEQVLRVFVSTVVPGVNPGELSLSNTFYDAFYPLCKHLKLLVKDIENRTRTIKGRIPFTKLSRASRTKVIENGLNQGGIIKKLYSGAIFFTQFMVFTGNCHHQESCSLIGFEGPYYAQQYSMDEPLKYLPKGYSINGNPY
jgi:hypothetical protein